MKIQIVEDNRAKLAVRSKCAENAGAAPERDSACDDLILCADRALYRAKDEGRRRVCRIEPMTNH